MSGARRPESLRNTDRRHCPPSFRFHHRSSYANPARNKEDGRGGKDGTAREAVAATNGHHRPDIFNNTHRRPPPPSRSKPAPAKGYTGNGQWTTTAKPTVDSQASRDHPRRSPPSCPTFSRRRDQPSSTKPAFEPASTQPSQKAIETTGRNKRDDFPPQPNEKTPARSTTGSDYDPTPKSRYPHHQQTRGESNELDNRKTERFITPNFRSLGVGSPRIKSNPFSRSRNGNETKRRHRDSLFSSSPKGPFPKVPGIGEEATLALENLQRAKFRGSHMMRTREFPVAAGSDKEFVARKKEGSEISGIGSAGREDEDHGDGMMVKTEDAFVIPPLTPPLSRDGEMEYNIPGQGTFRPLSPPLSPLDMEDHRSDGKATRTSSRAPSYTQEEADYQRDQSASRKSTPRPYSEADGAEDGGENDPDRDISQPPSPPCSHIEDRTEEKRVDGNSKRNISRSPSPSSYAEAEGNIQLENSREENRLSDAEDDQKSDLNPPYRPLRHRRKQERKFRHRHLHTQKKKKNTVMINSAGAEGPLDHLPHPHQQNRI